MGLNAAIVLADSARRRRGAPALHVGSESVTYAELDAAGNRFANALLKLGVRPGDVVGLFVPNSTDFVACFFGALKLGATVMPLNTMLRERELVHCLNDSGAVALVVGSDQEAVAVPVAESVGITHVIVAGGSAGTNPRLAEMTGSASEEEVWTETDPSDTAVLLYTSGTTGTPKGACLTHSGLLWVANAIARDVLDLTTDDVVLQALPLSHIFGLNTLMISTLLAGAALVLERHFDAKRTLDLLVARSVTVFGGVPTMAIGLLAACDGLPVESPLRMVLLAGQSVPTGVRHKFAHVFGSEVIECYGISEYSSAVTAPVRGVPQKDQSVGEPIWGTQVAIENEFGDRCEQGEVGEIIVRGVGLMSGYHNQPQSTATALRNGWLHTGDLGRLDDDGQLFIVDRKKDLIIRGGYNVYPREVEDVLYEHPDVLEAAVLGIADEMLGEEIAAAVRLRKDAAATPEELRDFTRTRLAGYKYPRVIAVVDDIPKSSTGKILKRGIDHSDLVALAKTQSGGIRETTPSDLRGQENLQ